MSTFKTIFGGIDYTFQLLLLSSTGLCALLSAFDQKAIFFYLLSLFFTGSWQLFSAMMGGIVFHQGRKLLYLACAMLYCVMLYFGMSKVFEMNGEYESLGIVFVCILPTIAAGVYFWMCLQEEPKAEEYV